MKIDIPENISVALEALNKRGFDAYVVGGCVRDSCLGRTPQDWDITTDAKPEEIKLCFPDLRVIETGIRHGTVSVLINKSQVEITTYRIDGDYTDHRRPDSVEFTRNLAEDLSRRDFTVNAMAYNPSVGLVDYFDGLRDLQNRQISCVGDAAKRFSEDALRILRAVRFSSVMGFTIAKDTRSAMDLLAPTLSAISAERIASELNKALLGDFVSEILLNSANIFMTILPELAPMQDFDQHTRYHHLNCWRHTVEAVKNTPPDLILRMTMLLHDIGKPSTFTLDEQGAGHFYGHAAESARLADEVLSRLRYDNSTRKQVVNLIKHHGDALEPDEAKLKRALNRFGEEDLRRLIQVKYADSRSQALEFGREREEALGEIERVLGEIISQNQAFSLRDLAVGGHDLLMLGFSKDKGLGEALDALLGLVIDGELQNEHDALLERAKKLLNQE